MTSRISAVTTVDEESDDGCDDISLHLRSFTADLDEITKTLEQESQDLFARAARGHGSSSSRRPSQPSSRDTPARSFQTTPPAATYGRSWNFAPATEPTGTRDGPLKQQYSPSYRSDGEAPTPMQTPAPLMFSPVFGSEPRLEQNGDRYRSRQSRDTSSYTRHGANVAESAARQDRDDGPNLSLRDLPRSETVETWKYLLNLMRDTVDRQDDRIQTLQRENEDLRDKVRSLEQDLSYIRRNQSPLPAPPRHAPSSVHYAASPQNPLRPSYSPLLSSFTSPRTNLASPYRDPGRSTPGTQFVAELTRLVEVDPVYHDPLSRIMDDHFSRTTQIREKYGWDENY